MDKRQVRAFEGFAAESGAELLRIATLLTPDPHAAVELRPSLRAALNSLGEQQRAVVVLRYFDDRSEDEVARLLGITTGTVKSTASRAIAHLRAHPGLTAIFTASDSTV